MVGYTVNPNSLAAFCALISGRLLVDVQRHDLHVGPVPCAADWISHEKTIRDVLNVRQISVDGSYNSNSFHSASPERRLTSRLIFDRKMRCLHIWSARGTGFRRQRQ